MSKPVLVIERTPVMRLLIQAHDALLHGKSPPKPPDSKIWEEAASYIEQAMAAFSFDTSSPRGLARLTNHAMQLRFVDEYKQRKEHQ